MATRYLTGDPELDRSLDLPDCYIGMVVVGNIHARSNRSYESLYDVVCEIVSLDSSLISVTPIDPLIRARTGVRTCAPYRMSKYHGTDVYTEEFKKKRIMDCIDRLHKRQEFFRRNADRLPNWR